jgi:pimeloyl-ACP methyl ester carboxylesterase
MATFVLVHGSSHGSWCWQALIPELEARGHRAIGPDLPCEDLDAGAGDYADLVDAAIDDSIRRDEDRGEARSKLVLVGHSLGSRTIPVVAARHPGAQMVFLCSVPTDLGPVDPKAFEGMVTAEYAAAEAEVRADGATRLSPAAARAFYYEDCPEHIARWASQRLRWQGPRPLQEPMPLTAWPEGPIDIVLTRDDRVIALDWALRSARRWLEGREPVLLPGSHSPFLSRPVALADALIGCLRG